MPWRFLPMDEHFERIKANFIRCDECNENFYFDFLRHPRYFVTHFKACHLKNLLYRFNGYSEEENQKIRFGPRRKRDANAWFGQLKSTEKRMISMQDNKWSEITEQDCWSCRLCNDGKADLTHVFELGRGQAFIHLRQFHEGAYSAFLQSLPPVENATLLNLRAGEILATAGAVHAPGLSLVGHPPTSNAAVAAAAAAAAAFAGVMGSSTRTVQQRLAEAERSRERRLRATPEERRVEAQRSKRRRENLTPVQRQADYDRRKRKKKRLEESERSRKRREEADEETKRKEVLRSRERRRNATDEQRQREALRSRLRRQNATEAQRVKERERCRKRYEAKKHAKDRQRSPGETMSGDDGDDTELGDGAAIGDIQTTSPPDDSRTGSARPPRPSSASAAAEPTSLPPQQHQQQQQAPPRRTSSRPPLSFPSYGPSVSPVLLDDPMSAPTMNPLALYNQFLLPPPRENERRRSTATPPTTTTMPAASLPRSFLAQLNATTTTTTTADGTAFAPMEPPPVLGPASASHPTPASHSSFT